MSAPRARAALGAALPWLLVLVGVAWLTGPLWQHPGQVLAGRLSTDTMLTAWFMGRVAEGGVPATLDGFDFPEPFETAREFPSVAEARLLAPLVRLLGWPSWWNAAIVLAVLLAALGCAALARVSGAGPRGVVVAGLLGALCRPLWFEAVSARFNALWPGLVLLGLALGVAAVRGRGGWTWAALLAGVGLAVLGLWVYPPWAVILAPLALAVGLPALGGAGRGGWARLVLGLLLVGGLSWFLLQDALQARVVGMGCQRLACPDRFHAVAVDDLFRAWVEPADQLARGGLPLALWVLAPAAVAWRRVSAPLLLLGVGGLCLLALGPCPRLGDEAILAGLYAHDPAARPELWCGLDRITDYGRFATGAGLALALLSGQAAGGLGGDGSAPRWRPALAWGLGLGLVAWAGWVHLVEVQDARRWHTPEVPAAAAFLRQAEPGPAAELPFDRQGQFLSALADPGRPRVNPLKRQPRRGGHDPVVAWLRALGSGTPSPTPGAAALSASSVRWVLWDPGRCGVPAVPDAACAAWIPEQLERALGAPVEVDDEVRAWRLGP